MQNNQSQDFNPNNVSYKEYLKHKRSSEIDENDILFGLKKDLKTKDIKTKDIRFYIAFNSLSIIFSILIGCLFLTAFFGLIFYSEYKIFEYLMYGWFAAYGFNYIFSLIIKWSTYSLFKDHNYFQSAQVMFFLSIFSMVIITNTLSMITSIYAIIRLCRVKLQQEQIQQELKTNNEIEKQYQ